jgi:uncharacterized protein with HEPN domain
MSARRKWHFRIEHILDAIAKIQRYTAGMSEDAFAADRLVVDAVERNFTIIGEAARQIPVEIQAKHPEIPWARVQGMRNILVHEYDAVRLDVVWRTIQNNLPPLVEPLQKLVREEPE